MAQTTDGQDDGRSGNRIRIGAVNYLNTKPLVYGLEQLAPNADVIFDLPSRLADRLASKELDVALIPSIEAFNDPNYSIVSDACIGCRGPVLSVKLFSRVPAAKIRSIALDAGSRTSIALVRILLAEQFGLTPEFEPLPIGANVEDSNSDAILLIGDRAMHSPGSSFQEVWDLGHRWVQWANLPFVFALWTARKGVDLSGIDTALEAARDAGVANLREIAATEAAALGLSEPQCYDYLANNLHFHFHDKEREGLELFYRHACKLGLAPTGVDLEFANFHTAR